MRLTLALALLLVASPAMAESLIYSVSGTHAGARPHYEGGEPSFLIENLNIGLQFHFGIDASTLAVTPGHASLGVLNGVLDDFRPDLQTVAVIGTFGLSTTTWPPSRGVISLIPLEATGADVSRVGLVVHSLEDVIPDPLPDGWEIQPWYYWTMDWSVNFYSAVPEPSSMVALLSCMIPCSLVRCRSARRW